MVTAALLWLRLMGANVRSIDELKGVTAYRPPQQMTQTELKQVVRIMSWYDHWCGECCSMIR